MEWNDTTEKEIINLAEQAHCYRYLHSQYVRSYFFDTLTILVSGINGCLNLAILLTSNAYLNEILLITAGVVNLLLVCLTSYQKMKRDIDTELEHRWTTKAWRKLHSTIKDQLILSPEHRMDYSRFIDRVRYEFNRIIGTSPVIPDKIIYDFRDKFMSDSNVRIITTEIEEVD